MQDGLSLCGSLCISKAPSQKLIQKGAFVRHRKWNLSGEHEMSCFSCKASIYLPLCEGTQEPR